MRPVMIGPSLPSLSEVLLARLKAMEEHDKSAADQRRWWGQRLAHEGTYRIADEPVISPMPVGWRFTPQALDRLIGSMIHSEYWEAFRPLGSGERELYGLPLKIVPECDLPYPGWEIVLPRNHRNIPVNLDHRVA